MGGDDLAKNDLSEAQAQALGGGMVGAVLTIPSSVVLAVVLGASFPAAALIGVIAVGVWATLIGALVSGR